MRLLVFLLGMLGFIAAGMWHVTPLGIAGLVLAIIALLWTSPQQPRYQPTNIRSSPAQRSATLSLPTANDHSARSRHCSEWRAWHSARHQRRHAVPTHSDQRRHRATQKEK